MDPIPTPVVRKTHPSLAPAHTDDPSTSHEAATKVKVSRQMFLVLEALTRKRAPMTNDEIHAWSAKHSTYFRRDYPHGLSTRRGKLQDRALVAVVDENGKSHAGNRCQRYTITNRGLKAWVAAQPKIAAEHERYLQRKKAAAK